MSVEIVRTARGGGRVMHDASSTEDLVKSLLERLGARDADAIAALFEDHIDWYVGGNPELPWTGTRSRGAEVAEYFRSLWSHVVTAETSVSLSRLIVSGNDAIIFATFTNTAASTGRRFSMPVAMHLTVANLKFVSLRLYEDTWLVSQAFFPKATLSIEPTIVESRYAFLETVEELRRAITSAGARVFATVDQQAAAVSVGLSLRPTVVMLFGNPKGGSPLMEACPMAGLELPLKLMIWEERQIVRVAHAPIAGFGERCQISGEDSLIEAMGSLLKRVLSAVAKAV